MHGADGNLPRGGFHVFVQHLEGKPGGLGCRTRPVQFSGGTNEDADFVGQDALFAPRSEPLTHFLHFLLGSIQDQDVWWWSVEQGNGAAALLGIAVHVRYFDAQQAVGLDSDLG
jgi:hypothetical protein